MKYTLTNYNDCLDDALLNTVGYKFVGCNMVDIKYQGYRFIVVYMQDVEDVVIFTNMNIADNKSIFIQFLKESKISRFIYTINDKLRKFYTEHKNLSENELIHTFAKICENRDVKCYTIAVIDPIENGILLGVRMTEPGSDTPMYFPPHHYVFYYDGVICDPMAKIYGEDIQEYFKKVYKYNYYGWGVYILNNIGGSYLISHIQQEIEACRIAYENREVK